MIIQVELYMRSGHDPSKKGLNLMNLPNRTQFLDPINVMDPNRSFLT